MSFNQRFIKTATIGSLIGSAVRGIGRAALTGAKGLGKTIVRAGGGGLMGAANVGLSGMQAADDYSKFNQKMLNAQNR